MTKFLLLSKKLLQNSTPLLIIDFDSGSE